MTELRARLRAGHRLVGTVLSLPGATLAELAAAPFDLVWIDLEHGALDVADAQELAVGAQAAGAAVAVRVPRSSWGRLPAVLDAGVDGVVVPGVESPEEAYDVARRLRYPPHGTRGYGPRRAGRFGRTPQFWSGPDAEVACIVQIESPAAVEAAGAIAAVPGVDALVVGTADLSLLLGAPQQLRTQELQAAVSQVWQASRAAGIAFGLAGSAPLPELVALAGPDARLLIYSADVRLYAEAMDRAAASLRTALASEEQHVGS